MDKIRLKPAAKDGAKKVAEAFERRRKKEPSDELVKIIADYQAPLPPTKSIEDERAARDVYCHHGQHLCTRGIHRLSAQSDHH